MDSKTFDLIGALEGRSYPQEDVDVYLDEGVAHEIELLEETMKVLAMHGDAEGHAELEARRDELAEKVRNSKVIFTIQGNSREAKNDIRDEWLARCLEKDLVTPKLPQNQHAEELAVLTTAAQTIKITGPDGSEVPLTEEVIRKFRLQAPDAAISRIEKALKRVNSVAEGFEIAVQSVDF